MLTQDKINEWEKEFEQMVHSKGQFIVSSRVVKQFIETLLKEQREELVEKIREIPTGNHKRADMRDDIIKMLSNLSPNKENKNNG